MQVNPHSIINRDRTANKFTFFGDRHSDANTVIPTKACITLCPINSSNVIYSIDYTL